MKRLTVARIDRLRRALDDVADCDELNQPYQFGPLAHETRAAIARAYTLLASLDSLRRSGVPE